MNDGSRSRRNIPDSVCHMSRVGPCFDSESFVNTTDKNSDRDHVIEDRGTRSLLGALRERKTT